jgi:hypothetical protein
MGGIHFDVKNWGRRKIFECIRLEEKYSRRIMIDGSASCNRLVLPLEESCLPVAGQTDWESNCICFIPFRSIAVKGKQEDQNGDLADLSEPLIR